MFSVYLSGPSQYKCECAKGWGPVKSDFCVEL